MTQRRIPRISQTDPIRVWKVGILACDEALEKWWIVPTSGRKPYGFDDDAICDNIPQPHLKAPALDCTCGFYAYSGHIRPDHKSSSWQLEVELSGMVLEHQDGVYRAEHQRILRIMPPRLRTTSKLLVRSHTTGHLLASSPFPGLDQTALKISTVRSRVPVEVTGGEWLTDEEAGHDIADGWWIVGVNAYPVMLQSIQFNSLPIPIYTLAEANNPQFINSGYKIHLMLTGDFTDTVSTFRLVNIKNRTVIQELRNGRISRWQPTLYWPTDDVMVDVVLDFPPGAGIPL